MHELYPGDKFSLLSSYGGRKFIGTFLGCEEDDKGTYARIHWDDGREYTQENPFDFIGCGTQVEGEL